MSIKALFLALLTLVSTASFAQKVITDSLLENELFKPYSNYFDRDLEWVYTHLNKSAYLPGDDIWFTSYVLNPANKRLNFATSKLYVELWSPEKKLVSRNILFVKAGTTNHNIHLAESLAPGTYCFRAYTSWMRNFYADNDLNTTVTILGTEKEFDNEIIAKHFSKSEDRIVKQEKNISQATRPDYDIQFLPESGTFLEGSDNILAVKAVDAAGKNIKISGKIFTAENKEISSFATSEFGTDKFMISETKNEQYIAKITLPDGTNRELMLPKAEPKGVVLHINSYRPDVVWFKIQTNNVTRQLSGTYILLLHANGVLYNNYRIRIPKENVMQFRVKKEEMGSGIVYATIFDESLTPVAERIFYNQDTNAIGNLSINVESLAKDTLKVNVTVADSLTSPQITKLSVSVLPGETILNQFNNSLHSESILRPALRGTIENPNSYFEKRDILHTIAIDNLLLTQGWRKYDWPTILKDTIPNFIFPFEEAFSVEGVVKNWLRNKPELKSKITFLSPQNNLFLLVPVDSLGKFRFDRVFLKDSTWIVASASSDKGISWNRVLQMSIPESVMDDPNIPVKIAPRQEAKEDVDDIPKLTKGTIQLKEFVITAQKKNLFKDNFYVGLMSRVFELTSENYSQFSSLESLLMIKFNIRTEMTQNGGYHFNMGRGESSFSGQSGEPIMMIDGMTVNDPQDILYFPLELVEAVAVDKTGLGGGMRGSAGTIAIKTRTTPLFVNDVVTTNIQRMMVKGYAPPIKYFEPKYTIQPGTAEYDKYAAIFWKPDLVVDKSNNASFGFFVPKEIQSLSLRIEGISIDGKIFEKEQKIVLPARN